MFVAFPLLALLVVLYNLVLLGAGGVNTDGASQLLANPLFTIHMNSGAPWPVTLGDLLITASPVLFFVELLKSTSRRKVAIVNHSLSMMLFVVCLAEFLLLRGFATTVFFLITLIVGLDVLGGFIVTIASSRREIDVRS